MKKLILILLVSALFLNAKSQNVNGILLADSANITVIQVWGNHYERGFAQGYLFLCQRQ